MKQEKEKKSLAEKELQEVSGGAWYLRSPSGHGDADSNKKMGDMVLAAGGNFNHGLDRKRATTILYIEKQEN